MFKKFRTITKRVSDIYYIDKISFVCVDCLEIILAEIIIPKDKVDELEIEERLDISIFYY